MLSGKKTKLKDEEIDEDDAIKQHQNFYGNGEGHYQQASSQNVGNAAAMQALKMFTGGKEEDGKGGQNKMIGLAMAQAAQLFDKQSSQGKTVSAMRCGKVIVANRCARIQVLRSRMLLLRQRRWR